MKKSMDLQPCGWAKGDIYLAYHDQEWGVPCYDERRLFEKLCLEGQQAGLSWITVLKKRDNYRQAFFQFDPEQLAAMTDSALETLLLDTGLIRNRLKIFSIRKNAIAYLKMKEDGISLAEFLWAFVDNEIQVNHFSTLSQVPAETTASAAMSKALKKKGFTFVGPTICYAFMQSMGMVNDHLLSCPCHPSND